MRITNSMMVSQFLSDANSSLNRVSKYQNQVDSTKKITRISDDPQATITALKARNRLSNLSLYQSNIDTANSYLSETESAAGELDDILQSAYEQIVSAQSGSKSDEEMAVIAQEVTNLRDEVLSIGNTSVGSSYIFGGYNYTGSTDGLTKTSPFSVQDVTGDLEYNGINVSRFAWQEEFSSSADLMTDFGASILAASANFSGSLTDVNALNYAEEALNSSSSLLSSGDTAMYAAERFGIDSGSAEYQAFSDFCENFSDLHDELELECSKSLAGDYILTSDPAIKLTGDGEVDYDYYAENNISVMTDEEYDNCFSQTRCQTILTDMSALLEEQYDAFGNPLGSDIGNTIQQLADVMTIPADEQSALQDEMEKQSELQIGTSQTVEFAYTGIDILGSGSDNIYHILDKCVAMLNGDMDSSGLSAMITTIQDKQSDVLTFQTKIGATQNRLSLIDARYDNSEINYTEMKSDAEDVDMAEAITNFTTAQTVYSAALAAGAELIQTSLIDFLS
ncbi:MAG: flagellar hook-associated protein FlgL [Oscillospiraceae bacterium]